VGAKVRNLTASTSLTHSSGYDLDPAIGFQTHVGSFDTVDLFFQYDLDGTGMWDKDLSFTLNVSNLFDKDPPFFNQDPGYANGFTLGRLIQIGARKRF
jgi:iron complex outermembrane receptor protein